MKHIKIAAGLAHVNYGNIAGIVKEISDAGVDYIHSDAADMHDLQNMKLMGGHQIIAGILEKVSDMTVFFNPTENSYQRFGTNKAPLYISWSDENRSQLVRIPAAVEKYRRMELRSPDPTTNAYLAFALIIYACMEGMQKELTPPPATNINFYHADSDTLKKYPKLPETFKAACAAAKNSCFIKELIPASILNLYCNK